MLLFKYVVTLAGLGILAVAAGLILYDAALAINFQGPAAPHRTRKPLPPAPVFCRPSVFLYQRALAERAARPVDVRVLSIRRRVRAWRRTAMS